MEEEKKITMTFGLQEKHIKLIEEAQKRWNGDQTEVDLIYSKEFWEQQGKICGWEPFTLALHYFDYLWELNKTKTGLI